MGNMKFNLTAHKELWNWLADNPEKEKEDWPGWKTNGGQYKEQENDCFACTYDTVAGCNPCYNCPLLWESKTCYYNPSPFVQWGMFRYTDNKQERSELARQIANLQVREGVECE